MNSPIMNESSITLYGDHSQVSMMPTTLPVQLHSTNPTGSIVPELMHDTSQSLRDLGMDMVLQFLARWTFRSLYGVMDIVSLSFEVIVESDRSISSSPTSLISGLLETTRMVKQENDVRTWGA